MITENFAGYVLAGGKSSRMGTDKALLEIGGETFVERAVSALKPACADRISVVLNPKQTNFSERIPPGTARIFDVYENRGALGGIHAALQDCRREWAIILAVDLPFADAAVIKLLTRAARDSQAAIAAVIPQQPDGRLQPLCGIYRPQLCAEKLGEVLQKNRSLSVRGFLENFPVAIVDAAKFASNKWFINVNTQADYRDISAEK